jgi:hypothetical protein
LGQSAPRGPTIGKANPITHNVESIPKPGIS